MFLDSELNREVTNGNPAPEALGSEKKLCPALRDNFWLLGYVMKLAFIFVPVVRENTLGAQGQRLIYFVYISFLAWFPNDPCLEQLLHLGAFYTHPCGCRSSPNKKQQPSASIL